MSNTGSNPTNRRGGTVAGTPAPGARVPMPPMDRTAAATAILNASADAVAPIVVPALDMYPDMGVALNAQSVPGNTTTNSIPLQFPTDGFVVGVYASTRDGLATSMAGMLLRVQVDGQDDLWSSGQGNGAGFMSFQQISGQFSNGLWRFRRLFLQATTWSIYLVNTTGGTIVCDLMFPIIDCRNPPA